MSDSPEQLVDMIDRSTARAIARSRIIAASASRDDDSFSEDRVLPRGLRPGVDHANRVEAGRQLGDASEIGRLACHRPAAVAAFADHMNLDQLRAAFVKVSAEVVRNARKVEGAAMFDGAAGGMQGRQSPLMRKPPQ